MRYWACGSMLGDGVPVQLEVGVRLTALWSCYERKSGLLGLDALLHVVVELLQVGRKLCVWAAQDCDPQQV